MFKKLRLAETRNSFDFMCRDETARAQRKNVQKSYASICTKRGRLHPKFSADIAAS
jgi:hypothetical protein